VKKWTSGSISAVHFLSSPITNIGVIIMKSKTTFLPIVLILFSGIVACKARKGSDVKVAGGKSMEGIEGSAVRCLAIAQSGNACCTSTFLNPTTVLTAAHCVRSKDNGHRDLTIHSVPPAEIFVKDENFFPYGGHVNTAMDIAILVFDRPLGDELGIKQYPPVALAPPNAGDTVFFEGFGLTDSRNGSTGGKHFQGQNRVQRVSDGIITLEEGVHWAENGEVSDHASPLSGDSGCSLLSGTGEVVGVCSTSWTTGEKGLSYFADVTTQGSKEFFRKIITSCGREHCAANFPGSTVEEAREQVSFFNWDKNQPSDYDHEINCVETKSTGKWHDEDCYATRAFACQSITESGRWILSAAHGKWNEYVDKCPSGYRFSVPKNSTEVEDVRAVLGGTGSAWINLTDQDKEGSYVSK
jgi:hypothetical protein